MVKLESLKRTRTGIERDLAIARTELPTLRATVEGKLATLARDEASLSQTSRESLARRAYDVTAASDGTIERVIALSGQTVAAGASLMQMQTGPRMLMADIYVPTDLPASCVRAKACGWRLTRFRWSALVMSRRLLPRWVAALFRRAIPAFHRPSVSRCSAFARRLASPSIAAYGETWPLRNGLAAQADIALDSRPLYLWLIEPILRLRGGCERYA